MMLISQELGGHPGDRFHALGARQPAQEFASGKETQGMNQNQMKSKQHTGSGLVQAILATVASNHTLRAYKQLRQCSLVSHYCTLYHMNRT